MPLLLSSLQTTAGDGRQREAAHVFERIQNANCLPREEAKDCLKNPQNFQARGHHREHYPRCLDFMEEGGPDTFVTPMSSSLSEAVEGQQQKSSVFCSLSGVTGQAHISIGGFDEKQHLEIRERVMVPRGFQALLKSILGQFRGNAVSVCWLLSVSTALSQSIRLPAPAALFEPCRPHRPGSRGSGPG